MEYFEYLTHVKHKVEQISGVKMVDDNEITQICNLPRANIDGPNVYTFDRATRAQMRKHGQYLRYHPHAGYLLYVDSSASRRQVRKQFNLAFKYLNKACKKADKLLASEVRARRNVQENYHKLEAKNTKRYLLLMSLPFFLIAIFNMGVLAGQGEAFMLVWAILPIALLVWAVHDLWKTSDAIAELKYEIEEAK